MFNQLYLTRLIYVSTLVIYM